MTPVSELPNDELLSLLKNDPDGDRLRESVQTALSNLRRLAGETDADAAVELHKESA